MNHEHTRAYKYLELAHREREFAQREHRFGRKLEAKTILSIAKDYERMAAKIIGDAAVVKFIIDHGKVMY